MAAKREADGRLLVVEDEPDFRAMLERRLKRRGYEVLACASAEEALEKAPGQDIEVAVLDLNLPGLDGLSLLTRFREMGLSLESIMLTGQGGVVAAVDAIKRGAYHYLEKPVKFEELCIYIDKALDKKRLVHRADVLEEVATRTRRRAQLVGSSPIMSRLRGLLEKVARSQVPILIEGETGTGKDVCANFIHQSSSRAEQAFVAMNCGALPESLLEDELFGHVRGAFTGAERERRGHFELADQGTLFLDEVGEMSLETQKKFLRVLETGELQRVGSEQTRRVDVRVVAATNKNLRAEVEAGRFREDLYYRLNVISVRTPALRDHIEDLPELVEFLLGRNPSAKGVRVSSELMAAMKTYRWPGNVRELKNVLERGQVLCSEGLISPADCPGLMLEAAAPPAAAMTAVDERDDSGRFARDSNEALTLEEVERRHISEVLKACENNKTKAAQELGISLRSLYRKLDKHRLSGEGAAD